MAVGLNGMNMKIINTAFYIYLLCSCLACNLYSDRVKVNEDYYLWTTEGRSDMMLCYLDYGEYNIGIIGPCAFAAGVNSEHIIVKTHPVDDGRILRNRTLFYIIPLIDKVSTDDLKNYYGPYGDEKFQLMRDKLGVSENLNFSIVLRDLE
jgi:hypothetical protein